MTVFFTLINIGFLFFVSFKLWQRQERLIRSLFWPALTVKLVAGICVGLVYTHYYTVGDTFVYFSDGQKLAALARHDLPKYIQFLWSGDDSFQVWDSLHLLQTRALFMAKLTSVVNLISHDNYWITSFYFSFVSFLGAWMVVKIIVRLDPSLKHAAAIAFLFFPSAVFWSSGLIKESLAMASVFVLTFYVVKGWMREFPGVYEWILIFLAAWLVWSLKYYFLVVFIPVAAACLGVRLFFPERLKQKSWWGSIALWSVIFILPILAVSFIRPNFYPDRFLHVIISNYKEFHAISAPDDLIYYHNLKPTIMGILSNAPWALFSGLYRPLTWEAGTLFKLIISVENTVLLILSCAALVKIRKMILSPSRMLLFSILAYVVMLSVFLALSTPNFGTLSRYRVGFLPFFFLLISIENPLVRWLSGLRQRSSGYLVP